MSYIYISVCVCVKKHLMKNPYYPVFVCPFLFTFNVTVIIRVFFLFRLLCEFYIG